MNHLRAFSSAVRHHVLAYGLRQARLVSAVLVPAALSTVSVLMQRSSGAEVPMARLLSGAGLSSLWGSLLATAMFSLRRERDWFGTLPLVSIAPTPLPVLIGGYLVAESVLSLAAVAVGLGTGCLWLGGIPPHINWLALVPSLVVVALSAASVASLLVPLVMRWPALTQSINALEYPLVILAGFLVPVSALPQQVSYISVLLPPYWALEAVGHAATGGSLGTAAGYWAPALLIGICYSVLGMGLASRVQVALRANGELAR
ncbi:ABC transporter permease [Streptomyces celluloflavus]|uniref:ABC transporter permease n=1 Tax=Streptomyces celluloflavus TaxID=58344 RepID=A0ABW7RKV3_9ACTN